MANAIESNANPISAPPPGCVRIQTAGPLTRDARSPPFTSPLAPPPPNPIPERTKAFQRLGRALRLASEVQYGHAMRSLTNTPLANLNEPITHAALGLRCVRARTQRSPSPRPSGTSAANLGIEYPTLIFHLHRTSTNTLCEEPCDFYIPILSRDQT